MAEGSHDAALSVFYGGSYHEIHGEIHQGAGVVVERGYAVERQIRPQKITWQFINTDNRWDPDNPTGLLYDDQGGQNMPVAVAADLTLLAVCEASELAPDQTADFDQAAGTGYRWVDMTAEGILRRIGQWDEPVASPMRLQILSYASNGTNPTMRGYWPLEDPRGAKVLTNLCPGGRAGYLLGADAASGTPADGASTAVKINTGDRIGGYFRGASISVGWQFSFVISADALPPDSTERPLMTWKTSNGYTWQWLASNSTYKLSVVDASGASKISFGSTYGSGAELDQALTFRFKATLSGGTVTAECGWYPQGGAFLYGFAPTYSGTLGFVSEWLVDGNATNDGMSYGHVFGVYGGTDALQAYAATAAFDGYAGEKAGDRFDRLCSIYNIARTYAGTRAETIPMGPQRPDTLANLLKECAETDGAMIYERRNSVGLTFRTRRNLQAQTTALDLTFPDDISVPFKKTYDDQGVMNRVTVSQREGSEAVAELLTGPMSSSTSPPGIGAYIGKVDVNVASELHYLEPLAEWWLNRGTAPMPRYPQVVIDLDDSPALTTDVLLVNPGDLISITGYAPDVIMLMVIGIRNEVSTVRHRVTFTCVPAQAFDTARYDQGKRYGVELSATTNAETTTSTAVEITTQRRHDCWSTTPGYDLLVKGERMTVTAMTSPTGTGPGPWAQTATVTRSVNGVVKSHLAGEPVALAVDQRGRYGL